MNISPAINTAIVSLARAFANREHYNAIITARLNELRAANVTLGNAKICPVAQAFVAAFRAAGLRDSTIPPYLSAIRRSLETGAALDLSRGANAKAKANREAAQEATQEATQEAEDKAARTPMSLAERLRRVRNADDFAAFAAFADKLAKTGTPITTIVDQYIAANIKG